MNINIKKKMWNVPIEYFFLKAILFMSLYDIAIAYSKNCLAHMDTQT